MGTVDISSYLDTLDKIARGEIKLNDGGVEIKLDEANNYSNSFLASLVNCHRKMFDDLSKEYEKMHERALRAEQELYILTTIRPLEELNGQEDVLLWYVPLQEAPIVGSTIDEHFDSYYQTHWSPLPRIKNV